MHIIAWRERRDLTAICMPMSDRLTATLLCARSLDILARASVMQTHGGTLTPLALQQAAAPACLTENG